MKVSGLFSDGAVLQRGRENLIYGIARAGETIEVELVSCADDSDKYSISLTADSEGRFETAIPAYEAGGPYEIRVTGQKDTICIHDVLFGDVYLLGGQSNMELTVGMIPDENEKTLREANNDFIRMFSVPHEYDFTGKERILDQIGWQSVSRETIADFSAIGYYFAKEKYSNDKVPVGLIHTAVGGAPIEALMSEENIRNQIGKIKGRLDINGDCNHGKMDGGSPVVSVSSDCCGSTYIYNLEHDKHRGCIYCYDELFKKNSQPGYAENIVKEDLSRVENWHKDIDERDEGLKNEWESYDWSDKSEDCVKIEMPAFFAGSKYEDWFGTLWLQKTFYVSEKHAGIESKLYLGTLVDFDQAYVNGVKVGQTDYRYPQRRYVIPAGVIKPGRNTVTVRLGMDGNVGGFLPDMPYKVSIDVDICSSGCSSNCQTCGGDCNNNALCRNKNQETIDISLTGEWLLKEGARANRLDGETFFIWHPSALYNSMLAPLRGLAVDAILFYQGESNSFAPEYYDILFNAMVKEWRGLVGDVPVLYSELAVYLGDGPKYLEDSFAKVRESLRTSCRNVENAYLIEITKLPAPYNELHPQNKKDVAHMFFEKMCEIDGK